MIKAIIIDDENNAIKALTVSIGEFCPNVEVIGTANSAFEGIKLIQQLNPDLVFVDIEMPNMTGIELMEQFTHRDFDVIFVTAYNQYAVKAFKLNAIDYLMKPINILELINAVQKIEKRIDSKQLLPEINFDKLKVALSGKLAIPTSQGTEYLNIKDIIRIEAEGSYSVIYTNDNKKKLVSRNLKSFEDSLINESFVRTHKSHIINLEYIKKFYPQKDGGLIEMTDGNTILISRTAKSMLNEILNKYTLYFLIK